MKNKRFFKMFIFGIIAAFVACTPFVLQKNNNLASAASPIGYFGYNKGSQSKIFVVDSIITDGKNEKILYLYSNGNDISSAKEAFSCYNNNNFSTSFTGSESEVIYRVGSASAAVKCNGQLISSIDLSNNIIIAMNNGYTNLNASAYYASAEGMGSVFGKDLAESVSMSIYVYNTDSGNSSNKSTDSEVRNNYLDEADVLSLSNLELSGKNANRIEFVFTSTYGGSAMTTTNYMRVKLPQINFTTSDLIIPQLDLVGGSNEWAKERILTLSASDYESGIQKIEVSKDGEEWQTAVNFTEDNIDYKTENSGSFTLTENGTYRFRAVDNVGNISEELTYIESHIDRIVPNIEVNDLTGFYTSKTFSFTANLFANDNLSQNYFNYSVLKNGAVIYSSELAADNSFTVPENGKYDIVFTAIDEAGNEMESFSHSLYFVDINMSDYFTTYNIDFSTTLIDGANYTYEYYRDGSLVGSNSLQNGNNSLTLSDGGKYTLIFKFFATINGKIYTITEKNIDVDFTIYNVTTSAVNGTISASYSSIRASDEVVEFSPNDGYELYALTINGDVVSTDRNLSSYTFELDRDLVIEARFRKIVSVSITENYVYNYGNLNLDYDTEIDKNLVSFVITDLDGNIIDQSNYHFNAGVYNIFYEIDTENYGGRGTVQIEILPKEVIISNIETTYKFSDNGVKFSFDSSEAMAEVYAKFLLNGVETNFYEAGEYTFIFVSNNTNFSVSGSGIVVIIPNILSVYDNNVIYDGTSQTLKFTSSMTGIAPIFVEYYQEGVLVTNPINVGTYNAKFYFMPNETAYEIEAEDYELIIGKREIEVSVDSFEHEYDGTIPEVTYTIKNMVEGENYSFSLIYNLQATVGTYNVSIDRIDSDQLANYKITYVDGSVKIIKRKLTILATEGLSKEYASEDPELTYSGVYGLLEGDTFELTLTRETGENVGYYNILVKNFESENYELNFIVAKFQITKRLGFVSIVSTNKVYGDNDPVFDFVRKNTNILDKDIDLISSLITREVGENAGTYKLSIDQSLVQNYLLITKDATFTILKRDIKVIANNITTIYGQEKELTYFAENLVFGDTLSGGLVRELGNNVGSYKISLGTLSSENYNIIEFVAGEYKIEERTIIVEFNSSSKTYGEQDNLTYSVTNMVESDILSGSLARESGENVGLYKVGLGTLFAGENYKIEFIGGYYEILPAEISIIINSQTKMYNEKDVELTYSVYGSDIFDVSLKLVREPGEDVGSYRISLAEGQIFENYIIISVTEADFVITKAKIDVSKMLNKTTTYSGEAHSIDKLQIAGIGENEIRYYYDDGFEKSLNAPVNAGVYQIKIEFDGNENFEAYYSSASEATLIINKKFLPITITKCEFVYDGKAKTPGFDVNIDVAFMPYAEFVGGDLPVEIGSYEFTFNLNVGNQNYYYDQSAEFKALCVLKIVSPFSNSNGNATVSTGSANYSDSKLEIVEVKDSGLKSMFSSSANSRRCISVYSFKNIAGYENYNDILTVSIKQARAGKDVEIYLVDKYGNLTPVSYELIDGYYVLSVNDPSSSILVTVTDRTAFYSKVFVFVMVLAVTYFASKSIRKRKNNTFFNRNTSFRKVSDKDLMQNKDIVESQILIDEIITPDKYLN